MLFWHSHNSILPVCLFLLINVLFLSGCDELINDNDFVVVGDKAGMIYQEYDPPLISSLWPPQDIKILPDNLSDEYIEFSTYTSGPTGCRNFKQETIIGGSENISFLYNYEEHTEYYSAEWKEYVYTWDGVEIDMVLEYLKSFSNSDSVVGVRGENVISAFNFADTVFKDGNFREGGSLKYVSDKRLDYSISTDPIAACRIESDSSYVRNDTIFAFFTTSNYHYSYNHELYNPDGVFIVFKLNENERERLGWLKIITTGAVTSVYECAIQE